MSRNRYAKNQDANHSEIVRAFESMGATVEAPAGTRGFPDLLVGIYGITELVEIKPLVGETRRRELRDSQVLWHQRWRGRKPVIVRTVEDALALVSKMRGAMTRSEVSR